jgi:hypothetical protein
MGKNQFLTADEGKPLVGGEKTFDYFLPGIFPIRGRRIQ